MFEGAKFGDKFETRDSRIVIFYYQEETEDIVKVAQFIGGTISEIVYHKNGQRYLNRESDYDIVRKIDTTDLYNENEQLKDALDALHMTYISQVSLWKSRYENLKSKTSISEEELNRLAEEYVHNNGGCEDCEDGIEMFKAGYKLAIQYL